MNRILKNYYERIHSIDYAFRYWEYYDYSLLSNIRQLKSAGKSQKIYNDAVIMGDTETSKKDPASVYHNHVVAWTITVRSAEHNLCTLWGKRPDDMITCIDRIRDAMPGEYTYIFFHNLSYDWVFLRRFMIAKWEIPEKQLNVKSHYPIAINFHNGLIFRDSLILAGRGLDKWSKDLGVEHKKAVGKWDYDKIRTQDENYNDDELEYIEHDTLAGVECIDATMRNLGKHIYSLPYTATGIPREAVRKIGKIHDAHRRFEEMCLSWELQQIAQDYVYHGGYTHANRHYINRTIKGLIKCYDFISSYPFIMLAYKFPIEKFTKYDNCYPEDILKLKDTYAFIFKFIVVGINLRDDSIEMPVLQMSKTVKNINSIVDNGRILTSEYVEIYLMEIDLQLIHDQYKWIKCICTEVHAAKKGYLPRWFTDYVYKCYIGKTKLKGGDPVLYSLEKAKLNSLYGMCVQHPVRPEIIEDYETGEYTISDDKDMKAEYEKFCKRRTSVLPYQWGIWVTAYAMYNLHQLGKCCKKWLYSDTDSVYGIGWDMKKLDKYNAECIRRLNANNYYGVEHDGKVYNLGVAELDGEYTEFRTVGAKRYTCRRPDGSIKITVAGVPKSGYKCLNDNIDNFTDGLIFSGSVTGKKTHTYFYVDEIYTDDKGNITGDSIDLSECDYLLQSEKMLAWEDLIYDKSIIQRYDIL